MRLILTMFGQPVIIGIGDDLDSAANDCFLQMKDHEMGANRRPFDALVKSLEDFQYTMVIVND